MDSLGRLIIFQEIVTEDMGLIQMVQEKLKPLLYSSSYVNRTMFVVADPSGNFKGQLTEDTPFSVLRDEGFMAYPAPTNDLEPRLRAVEKRFLMRNGLLISRAGCPTLIKALSSMYRYRRKQTGTLDDLPEKSHPWSDLADCLQYGCLSVNMNLAGRVMRRVMQRSASSPQRVSAGGWT
jgi:hypothetical protein